jgi:hypothetical protein
VWRSLIKTGGGQSEICNTPRSRLPTTTLARWRDPTHTCSLRLDWCVKDWCNKDRHAYGASSQSNCMWIVRTSDVPVWSDVCRSSGGALNCAQRWRPQRRGATVASGHATGRHVPQL